MKKNIIIVIVLSMLVSSQAAELYREEFTPPTCSWNIATVGWAVVASGGGTSGGLFGLPCGNGVWVWHASNPPVGYEAVAYTTEATINTVTHPYLGFQFDLRINYNGTTPFVSLAVKVGSNWYVSKQATRSTSSTYAPYHFYYNPAKENWDTLNMTTAQRGSTPAEDLTGNIVGFGMYSDTGPVDGIDCTAEDDNFIIKDVNALNPVPWDHAELVGINVDLQWSLSPDATNCYVYFGTNSNITSNPKVIDGPVQTSYDPGTLAADTNYYWRVDVNTVGGIIAGDPWTFKTVPNVPVILDNPVAQTVASEANAVLSVKTINATTFQWYKDNTPISAGGDISVVSDANGSTLSIANTAIADEGYYYCKVSDGFTDVNSAVVRLLTQRLMAHWKFENNLTDEITSEDANFVDVNSIVGTPSYDDGIVDAGKACVFEGDGYFVQVQAPDPNYFNFYPVGYTVSCWVKSSISVPMGIVSKFNLDAGQGWLVLANSQTTSHHLGQIDAVETQSTVNDGQWHFVAATYDPVAKTSAIYIDGKVGNIIYGTAGAPQGNPTRVEIGLFRDWKNWLYEGLIDDVKIYSYSRDAYTIAQEYASVTGQTVCVEPLWWDVNGDCVINFTDLKDFANEWLTCNKLPLSACD